MFYVISEKTIKVCTKGLFHLLYYHTRRNCAQAESIKRNVLEKILFILQPELEAGTT